MLPEGLPRRGPAVNGQAVWGRALRGGRLGRMAPGPDGWQHRAMTPFRDLPPDRQTALRTAYAEAMARQSTTCSLDEKIARFAAWLAPQGISFDAADLPQRRRRAGA